LPNLQLSVAIGDYDQLRDLTNGRVRAEGIDIHPINLSIEETFFRFIKFQEWDVSEVSFAKALSLVSQDNPWLVLIPVFPSRAFRHSSIYIRKDSGITQPQDLAGKRIGIPEWAQTASIYSRGLLAHEYGIDLRSIEWFQAGVNDPGRKEKVNLQLPEGIRYKAMPEYSLSQMLLDGQIDAALSARPPNAFLEYGDEVQRLFPNYRELEMAYWQKTKIFPIMHVIAIKRETYEKNRWIAGNLLNAFEEAKNRSLERASDITASYYPIPWVPDHTQISKSIMGEDYWPYGIENNRDTLEAFTKYAFEQGITQRHLRPEEIFVKEVLDKVKV
jgi:4,5-dihydroxyphthalate decarboxylase